MRLLVIGGSSGLGLAVALRMRRTARILVLSRKKSRELDALDDIGWAPCDVTGTSAVDDLRVALSTATHVVHCAAVGFYTPLTERDARLDAEILNTNVLGARAVAEAILAAPHVEHLVHVSSMAVHRGTRTPGNQLYAASKTAAAHIMDDLRATLRGSGRATRISKISPGYLRDTAFVRDYYSRSESTGELVLDSTNSLSCDDVAWWIATMLRADPRVEVGDLMLDLAPQRDQPNDRSVPK